jgi:ABC-type nickel/cobalt efflux system permease component RcnA/Tol biopolymer transport system component
VVKIFLRSLITLLIPLILASLPSRASAHPADMYAQNQSIQLTRAGLQIDWKILPGPFLADAVWAAADLDQNGAISQAEAQAWVEPFLSDLSITFDSQSIPVGATPSGHPTWTVRWPATVDVLRTGDDAVKVKLQMDWSSNLRGRHALEIHNVHLESNSLNWFSLAAQDGWTFGQPAQDNGRLIFDVFIPTPPLQPPSSAAARLTTWTSGTPNLPDFTGSLSRLATNLTNPASSAPAQTGGASAVTSALTGLVRNVQLSPLFLLFAFLLSLALGSLHALTPGHGKALVGAYLVGSSGRTRDAVLLGAIVTITHTGSVLALGLITLLASHYILPALIVPWLELISGLLVIAFGLNLLIQRRRDLPFLHAHDHPGHGHDHLNLESLNAKPQSRGAKSNIFASLSLGVDRHDLVHTHDHSHPQYAISNPKSEIVNRKSEIPAPQVTLKLLVALGVSGGLVPCPDAIAILLVAVALNRVPFGMLLIVSFSLGLAAVLIGIGIALVHGVRLISRSDWLVRFGTYAPVVSALVVSGLGIGLTLNAWNSFKFSSAAFARAGAGNVVASEANQSSSRLLYVAPDSSGNDQLFMLAQPGSSPAQFTHEPQGITGYSVSPDGKTILYSVFNLDGGSSLWSLDADGSGGRLALDCPQAECNSPAWYPDGSKVAYERLENTPDSATIPRFSIWWLDLQSGRTQPVFQDASFPSAAPQFSPDGEWLSYISAASNALVVYDLEDARTLSVPLGSQAAIPETWSPAGDALLFGNTAASGEPPPLHVKTYALASGHVTDLGGTRGETDFSASWSPNGQWIAINRNVPGSNPAVSSNQVWLVKPDRTQAHVLLNEEGASYSGLSWSPDGRLLLYSRYTLDYSTGGTGHFDVLSTDIESGQSRLLAPGGDLATFLP